MMYLGIITR
ncbi:UNVERIFIED_CONTAM: hypothetical protein GTU68_011299 [Idotea baltica]|nr:hypothetical protein [Idotea baltica]MCL4155225.1 hypothetical protein [Idotea baltica]